MINLKAFFAPKMKDFSLKPGSNFLRKGISNKINKLYKNFNWVILDNAFKLINENNSKLIALHKNKYCKLDGRISLDLGPFVDAIEDVSGIKAEIMGKPEKKI